MKARPAQPSPAPLRALLVLTLLVLLAHLWLLQAAPLQASTERDAEALRRRPFITRSIEIKPAPVAATATVPAVVARRAARPPVRPSEPNQAPALFVPADPAIESIANTALGSAATVSQEPLPAVVPTVEIAAPPEAGPLALSIPGSVRLKYAMTGRSKGMDYSAWAELEWLQDGQTYDVKMVVSAPFLGSRAMSSSGRINGDGLAPTRFSDKSRGERATHFEAEKGKISFSANTPDAPWLRGAQDRVSVFLQLASMLAGDPAKYPAGSTVTLYTAGPREASNWDFAVGGEEKIYLPNGEMSAIKLSRKPQGDYDQTLEVWFAPALSYLPVRTRITQRNGDFVDQLMRVVEKP